MQLTDNKSIINYINTYKHVYIYLSWIKSSQIVSFAIKQNQIYIIYV